MHVVRIDPHFSEQLALMAVQSAECGGQTLSMSVVKAMFADPSATAYEDGKRHMEEGLAKFESVSLYAVPRGRSSVIVSEQVAPGVAVLFRPVGFNGGVVVKTIVHNDRVVVPGHACFPFMWARKVEHVQKMRLRLAEAESAEFPSDMQIAKAQVSVEKAEAQVERFWAAGVAGGVKADLLAAPGRVAAQKVMLARQRAEKRQWMGKAA